MERRVEDVLKDLFKDLAEAPTGGVKGDFTIGTLKESHTDLFIRTVAGHLIACGWRKPAEVVEAKKQNEKTARWTFDDADECGYLYKCSGCGMSVLMPHSDTLKPSECPFCKARMEVGSR